MDNNIKIEMKEIDSIIPYWRNPRKNDRTVDELVEVIKEFGFNVPIVIDEGSVVVKGHARLRAARILGMTEVPCIVTNESPDVVKADRLADNKIQDLGEWDFGKLEVEYEKIENKKFERLVFEPEVTMPEYSPVSPYVSGSNIVEGENVQGDEDSPDTGHFEAPESKTVRAICPNCGEVIYVKC